MNDLRELDASRYFRSAESWAEDRARINTRSYRLVCICAVVAAGIAVLEAIALVVMLPLKTVEPYTILVDRQTGQVQALNTQKRRDITPDAALVQSFLMQYVVAREGFNFDMVQENYRLVALWSAGDARKNYIDMMQARNVQSPLVKYPRGARVRVDLRSISQLKSNLALVRYSTVRVDPGGRQYPVETWVSIVKYRFSNAPMSTADRLVNPLGFQVLSYSRNAENMPAAFAPSSNDGSPPSAEATGRAPASITR